MHECHGVWEARFGPDNANQGQKILKRIRNDMTQFAESVDHETIADVGDPGHVVVISHWSSRAAADRIRHEYSQHPNALEANRLSLEPRRRIVGEIVDSAAKVA
jgi:quinol monooxygenase YgiN